MKRKSFSCLLAATAAVFLLGATDAAALTVPTPTTQSYTSCVKVSWNASSGATKYIVYRAATAQWSKRVKIRTTTARSFNDTSATPGVNYYYWVCPVQRNGSWWYNTGKYRRGYRQVNPPTPYATYNSYSSYVKLTWSRPTGAKYFRVWRSKSASIYSASCLGTTTSCSFYDTSAVAGTKYYYWVAAAGKNGVFIYNNSKRDYGMRKKVALTVPTPSGYFTSDYTYRVYWSAVSGAVKYKVFVSSSPSTAFWNKQPYFTTTSTSFTDSLNPGETWYYWVCPVDSSGTMWYNAAKYRWFHHD